jgi:hypothetical protein
MGCASSKLVKKGRVVLDVREKMQIGDSINIELGRERIDSFHQQLLWLSRLAYNTANRYVYFLKTVDHNLKRCTDQAYIRTCSPSIYLEASPSMRYENLIAVWDAASTCSKRLASEISLKRNRSRLWAYVQYKGVPHSFNRRVSPLSSWWLIDHGYLVLGLRMENSRWKGTTLNVSLTEVKTVGDIEELKSKWSSR